MKRTISVAFRCVRVVAVVVAAAGVAGTARGQYATGFEPPFTAGATLIGQQGWGGTTLVTDPAAYSVSTANPAAGGAQHLRLTNDAGVNAGMGGTFAGVFSPSTGFTNAGATPTVTTVDVFISNTGGADYDVILQSNTAVTARVKFEFEGNIFVVGNPGTGLAFIDTGVAWTPGVYQTLGITVDDAADSTRVTLNGTQIYTGTVGFAGTTVSNVLIGSDSFQLQDEFADFDNVSVVPVPEPAGLSLAALAAWLAVRARRNRV